MQRLQDILPFRAGRFIFLKILLDGEDLLHHRFTLCKTEVVGFAAGESG
jgi:hypothetical protein